MVISTEEDVIRVIRENPRLLFQALHEDPELLNEVRRLVLTEDLLAMPGQMAEVIERQDRMENRMDEVAEIQKVMTDQLGYLTDAELEREIVRILPSRLNRIYGLYRTRVILGRGVQSEHAGAFLDEVEDAKLASTISDGQGERIEETDMIVRARRREGRETIYIAVEASATIRQRDVTRAHDAAVALRAAFGAEAAAVAVGYEIRSEDRLRAESLGVEVITMDHPWRQAGADN